MNVHFSALWSYVFAADSWVYLLSYFRDEIDPKDACILKQSA